MQNGDVPTFHRYVAIGDSATEGLEDPDPRGGYRGWADRLAMIIADAQDEPLEYANIAIRGLRLDEIRTTQFDRAMAMKPDLMTIIGGVNDVIGLRPDFEQMQEDLEVMFGEARAAGITVLTLTMPDPARINPLGAYLRDRMLRLNEITHAAADQYGVQVLALERFQIAIDARLWAEDRLHGNAFGHERVAKGFAEILGLTGADSSWTLPLTESPEQKARRERMTADVAWARNYLGPWLVKGLRGIPHGQGIEPKRPVPTVVEVDGGDLVLATPAGPAADGVELGESTDGIDGAVSPAAGGRAMRRAGTDGRHLAMAPFLTVPEARSAMTWYAAALGAVPVAEPLVRPDGRVGHAELSLPGGRLVLAEPHAQLRATPDGLMSQTVYLEVSDVDGWLQRLTRAGATVEQPPTDLPYGRVAVVTDPYGHRWRLTCPRR